MGDDPINGGEAPYNIPVRSSVKSFIIIPEDTSIFNYDLFDIDDFIGNIGVNNFYVRIIIPIYGEKDKRKNTPEYLVIIKCKREELENLRYYIKDADKDGTPEVGINITERPGDPEITFFKELQNGKIKREKMPRVLTGKAIIIKNPEKEDMLNAIFDSFLIILYALKRGSYRAISIDGMIEFFKIQKELAYNYYSKRIIREDFALPSISKGDEWHKNWDIYFSELIGKGILEFKALVNLLCAEKVLRENKAAEGKKTRRSQSKKRMEGVPVAIVNISKEKTKDRGILKIYSTDIHNSDEIVKEVVNLPQYIKKMKYSSTITRNRPPVITIPCNDMKKIPDRFGTRGCVRCPYNGRSDESVKAYIIHISRWFMVTAEGKKRIERLMSDISQFFENIFGIRLEEAVENYFFVLEQKLPLIL